jgi:hypothetical protein
MTSHDVIGYVRSLPIGDDDIADAAIPRVRNAAPPNIEGLPNGFVSGSNLVSAEEGVSALTKSVVALSLLAAQRVADNDEGVKSPDQWIQRYNDVLVNLNWSQEHQSYVTREFDRQDFAVHQAIVPLLQTALGGAAGAMSMIASVLTQLQEIEKNSPWITLFDSQSQRFDVNEYLFTTIDENDGLARLSMAAARFGAEYGKTHVLFFKVTQLNARFDMAESRMTSNVALLEEMNEALKLKLARQTSAYIQEMDIGGL